MVDIRVESQSNLLVALEQVQVFLYLMQNIIDLSNVICDVDWWDNLQINLFTEFHETEPISVNKKKKK